MESYETVKAFCEACGLSNYRIEWHITRLNQLWIKHASDPKSLKQFLEGEWLAGNSMVRGVCDWIVNIVKLGASAGSPVAVSEGTAIMVKNENRDKLLRKLGEAYEEAIVGSLRFSSTDVDDRVARSYSKYSAWLMQVASIEIKLIWAMLGYSAEDCNLDYYIDHSNTPLVEARLLPILKANAISRHQEAPNNLCEVETDAEMHLLCKHPATERSNIIAATSGMEPTDAKGDETITGGTSSLQQRSLSDQGVPSRNDPTIAKRWG